MLTRTRLDKCLSTILLHFRFISDRICVSKIPNCKCNFLFTQLQITVILQLPLNPENPSPFFLISRNPIYRRSTNKTQKNIRELVRILMSIERILFWSFSRLLALFFDDVAFDAS